jgi:hypothetical protein
MPQASYGSWWMITPAQCLASIGHRKTSAIAGLALGIAASARRCAPGAFAVTPSHDRLLVLRPI